MTTGSQCTQMVDPPQSLHRPRPSGCAGARIKVGPPQSLDLPRMSWSLQARLSHTFTSSRYDKFFVDKNSQLLTVSLFMSQHACSAAALTETLNTLRLLSNTLQAA